MKELMVVLAVGLASAGCSSSLANPDELHSPIPESTSSTQNSPVTLCGVISATQKSPINSEYVLKNAELVVYLSINEKTDPDLIKQLHLVNGIFQLGGADGCVHGAQLPQLIGQRLVFEAEKGAIAIAGGGASVSN